MTELVTRSTIPRARPGRPNGATPPVEESEHLELRLWLRMISCSMKMESILSQRLRKEFKISMARFDVMSRLERHPDGLTMSELSRRLIVSNGAITGLVAHTVFSLSWSASAYTSPRPSRRSGGRAHATSAAPFLPVPGLPR